ncbi:MAG: helix-turn-helix domain-containing protein [Clostridia bacterium]|nr:helix-turn-helix domain-containing protein [Clostridia bacterium]
MDSKTTTVFHITKAAMQLFREKGFDATSIREIASTSNVSLGMINHYFGNKEFLGTQCLNILSVYCTQHLPQRLTLEDDPILYDLVTTRVLFQFLRLHGYSLFYRDSLKNDFFFKYLSDTPTILVKLLSKQYTITASDDEIQLYSRYMPYMMEKTLILKKEMGLFPTIDYDRIPYLIVLTALNHFIPEQDIARRDPEAIRIAGELVAPLDPIVPDDLLIDFVAQYVKKLQAASANLKSSWLHSMNQMKF